MRTWLPALTTLATLAVGVALIELAPWPPTARGDFRPFAMTIEAWSANRVGLADGRHLAATTTYHVVYQSRADWTMTLISDEVPGYGFVETPGQGWACRAGRYGQVDPSGSFRVTSSEPAMCNGIGRWIAYGLAWSYPWAKQISGGLVTYTDGGERVVFDLTSGLPLLYEVGPAGGPVLERMIFRVEGVPAPTVSLSPTASPLSRPTPTDGCAAVPQAVFPQTPLLYSTRTAADVLVGLRTDPNFRHTLEDIAGVRQDSNPLRDPAVPRCAVDQLRTGEPVFVRRYPSEAGLWYVPVLYEHRQVLLVTVGRNSAGTGTSGGSVGGGGGSGGAFPPMTRERALVVGGTPSDPGVSAELVFARAGRAEMIGWRVVRASGGVVYVFPTAPGAGPDGLILPEAQVESAP